MWDSLIKISYLFYHICLIRFLFMFSVIFIDLFAMRLHCINLCLCLCRLVSRNAADTICITIEDYCQDFVHLKDCYYDLILEKAEMKVLIEYLRALFSK